MTISQKIYKEIRQSCKALADSDSRFFDGTRLRLLQLVIEHPGIAYSFYKLNPEIYTAALESCKLLFEPRVFDPEQHFFEWEHRQAVEIEAEADNE